MAMIQCEECGRSISDKADTCPHCGYPIRQIKNAEIDRRNREYNKRFNVLSLIYNVIAFIVAFAFGYTAFTVKGQYVSDIPGWAWVIFIICFAIILLLCFKWIPWIFIWIFIDRYRHIPEWAVIITFSFGYVIGALVAM